MELPLLAQRRPRNGCQSCGLVHYKKTSCEDAAARVLAKSSSSSRKYSGNSRVAPILAGQSLSSSSSARLAPEDFPEIEFDVVNVEGENDEPTPEEMDPMLNYNDDSEVIAVPEGWKKHDLKASPKKRSCLQSEYVSIDTLPKSSAPKLASGKNVPAGTTSPFQFWKLFFNADIMGEFVKNTNIFGLRTQAVWVDVTVDILYNLFSIIFSMGIVSQPEMRSFWCGTEWVHSTTLLRPLFTYFLFRHSWDRK